jgi:hypothetical protein
MFVGERGFGFWGGMFGVRDEEKLALYAALRTDAGAVFPLKLVDGETLGHFQNQKKTFQQAWA